MDNKIQTDQSLISILSTPLRIREDKAFSILNSYAAFIQAAKSGSADHDVEANREANDVKVFSVVHNDNEHFDGFEASLTLKARGISTFKEAQPGSIVVIPVRGIMMRESSYSYRHGYVVGTRELETIVKAAEDSANISAIVFSVKSPGGEAAGNESLARVIKKCSIPTLVSFEGLASAAVESFIGVDELYAVEKDSYFGSVGTLTTVVDDSGFWAEWGIKFIEIYAPQSELKNKETREAKEGNTKPMEDRLEKSTDFFIKDVRKARPQIVDDNRFFKGAIYNAVEATKIKAIDGIKPLEFVITRAAFLARKNKRNNTNKMDTQNKPSEEQNKDSQENKNEEVAVTMTKEDKTLWDQLKGLFSGNKTTTTNEESDLAKANQEIGRLKALVTAHEKSIQDLTAEKAGINENLKTLQADFEHLKNAKTVEGEEAFETVEDMVKAYNATFDHNKKLGGNGKAPNLPVDNKETPDAASNKTKASTLTLEEREAAIEKALDEKRKKKAAAEEADK